MPRSVRAFLLLLSVLQVLQSRKHLCCQTQAVCICDCLHPLAAVATDVSLHALTSRPWVSSSCFAAGCSCCSLYVHSLCMQAVQLSETGILHLQPPQISGSNLEALLLACLQEMQIVPSIRAESLTEDPEHNDVYSAYNKPGAVLFWLRVSHRLPPACLGSLILPAAALCQPCVSRWLPPCLFVCFTLPGVVQCRPQVSQWPQHCLFS